MRTLFDLVNSPEGRHFLESKAIFAAQNSFVEQLEIPADSTLAESLGLENTKLVFASQQIYLGCTQSMISRMAILRDLEQADGLFPFFLWMDTDQAGKNLAVKFFWPLVGEDRPIRICPKAAHGIESRFVVLDPSRLQQAIDKLGMYISQSVQDREELSRVRHKYEQLRALFLQEHVGTLSEFNHQVTYFLLNNRAELNPPSVIESDIINRGLITAEINLFLNHLDEVIKVFNETVHNLIQQGIDPIVGPLAEDYLPLNYSCQTCDRRLRLHRETKGYDQFAVATCPCGENYRFHLGSRTLAIDELAQTKRWSPDLCMLVFLNDLVSGYVAGKSSGIYYGLVMKEVLEKTLNKRRVPVLIPGSLGAKENDPGRFDCLIHSFLTEEWVAPSKAGRANLT
jgi:hypothetical protein